jgi:hypothetical protein
LRSAISQLYVNQVFYWSGNNVFLKQEHTVTIKASNNPYSLDFASKIQDCFGGKVEAIGAIANSLK